MPRENRMFGLWPSPVTSSALAAGIRLGEPCWDTDGQTLAWIEGRSDKGVIVVQGPDERATRDLTSDISVRAFVGYGGGDFMLSHGAAYFVGQADQRIYRQELGGGRAKPITPAFGAASTPVVSPDGRWLAYVHTYEDADAIAVVDTQGKHWPQRLAEGRDFYMQPAWHPSSDRLAWVEWDHPNMPWDGTELKVARLGFPEGGLPVVAGAEVVAGGPSTSIFQGTFARDGGSLLYVSDETGWGQVYRRDLASGQVSQLTSGEFEYGTPAWAHGMKTFAQTASGTVVGVRQRAGFSSLVAIGPSGEVRDLGDIHPGYSFIGSLAAAPNNEKVAVVANGGKQPGRIAVFDLSGAEPVHSVRKRSDSESVPAAALSAPEPISWTSFDGETAHGIYWPPASETFEGTGAPPLIVLPHGGPTSQVHGSWHPQAQFFATRGYAVLCPNYRGSTGYGREYMLKLRESWGIYDVQDSKFGAQSLAERGLADPARLVIMGGSAGGYTVLQSLVETQGFYKAAICMFGVANMFTLAADTHKFEARYLDSMLGPLPEAAAIYRERSPIFHAGKIQDPIAVFQGEIDRVVPREQSDSIVASLKARDIPHEYHLYPGEGHGWRKQETIDSFYKSVEAFLKTYVLFVIHLDTDLGGDTDDLCALALLLGAPDVEVVGITTVADAEGKRRAMVEHALRLAGRSGISVASGAAGFLGGVKHFPGVQDARYWPGLEPMPPTSPHVAIELLEANAAAGATVVAIGPYTNLALLETLRPGAFATCPVVTMGGYLGMPEAGWPQWPATYDYNVQADRVAARIVFGRLDPLIASLNVTMGTALGQRDLPALRDGGPLSRLMAGQAELHAIDHKMAGIAAANPNLPADILNYQYDSVAVAAALGWDCLEVEEAALECRDEDGQVVLHRGGDHLRRLVTSIDAEAFAGRWLATVASL